MCLSAKHLSCISYFPAVSYTVLGSVEVGELACHTLVVAEDASTLSFITHKSESIVAERLAYTVTSGDAFTDGFVRKVCVCLCVCVLFVLCRIIRFYSSTPAYPLSACV